jgi:hypothetical protein
VPRNSSGTYSLYTPGNPVVTSTVISSTWANNTLADLASAITDSLSRSGDGGMQAPLELDNGAIGAPGLTWATETTSGWYRASAGNFRFSISATDVLTLTTGGLVAGAATGGAQGAGTINATAVYDDGVLLTPSPVGGNPSAGVGLSATNGVATTFMRSDAAPALSQSIAPTWTGLHIFSRAANALQVGGATNSTYLDIRNGSNTSITNIGSVFSILGGATSTTDSALLAATGKWVVYPNGVPRTALEVANTAIQFGNTTDNPSFTLLGSGTAAFGGNVTFTVSSVAYSAGYRGAPSRTITTSDSTAALDNGRMVLFTGAGSQTFTVDSDFGAAGNIMSLLNGGTGSLAIAESLSGTLTWLNGSGALSTGSRTLAIGGIATIWMVDANNAYIWGTGIS